MYVRLTSISMHERRTTATYVLRYVLKASIILVLTALIVGAVPFLEDGFTAVVCLAVLFALAVAMRKRR